MAALLICAVAGRACAQSSQAPMDVFVGSTPCDAYIKATLGIPRADSCEFIKWELTILKNKEGVNKFQLTAKYGIGQPNTNGFKRGGNSLTIDGNITSSKGNKSGIQLYRLQSNKIPSPLHLVKMDDNVFHFADNDQKLLVGNGGWGYVLNRLKY